MNLKAIKIKKEIYQILFILSFFGIIWISSFYSNYKDEEFKKNGVSTICKFTLFEPDPDDNNERVIVKYFVNGKVYRNEPYRVYLTDNMEKKLGKFFELKYLPENSNKVLVDFHKEIKDSIQIKELESKLTFKYWMNH